MKDFAYIVLDKKGESFLLHLANTKQICCHTGYIENILNHKYLLFCYQPCTAFAYNFKFVALSQLDRSPEFDTDTTPSGGISNEQPTVLQPNTAEVRPTRIKRIPSKYNDHLLY